MPDLGQVGLLILIGIPLALLIAHPFAARGELESGPPDAQLEALALRRSIAYDALRDLELDFRTGSLTGRQYLSLREKAELRAAVALADLEAAASYADGATAAPAEARRWRPGRRLAAGLAGLLAVVLLVGFVLPEPLSLANGTVVNEPLAQALAAEEARDAEIAWLQARLTTEEAPDPEVLSDLADAYLAGDSRDDLIKAALALLVLIQLDPDNESAHVRIISAYMRAGDYDDASRAADALEKLNPDSADVLFFRGLIALRGRGDRRAAVEAFDRFLEQAPDDPRAGMVRSLRAEAAGELPPGS
ncbi:MAG: tetratricopeptide repeat protein [Candidatus Limnocylindria bacterium]